MPADDSDARRLELDHLRLAAIIESSDDAIVSKDLDGTVRSWNPAAERVFGYSAAEMVGQSIFRVIPPELYDEEHTLLATIRSGRHVAHYETTRVRKDGRRIRISLTLSPLYGADGRLIGASVIKRDITAQRALEMQLQQAQRMESIGRLAGGIAHDFNNMLTVIAGLTGLIMRRHPAGTRDRTDLEQIAQAAERAGALTHQLLAFSRQRMVELEVLDANDVALGLEPMLRRLIGEHIDLRTALAPDLGRVRANRSQVEQVLVNLAANARDAMPDGGTLTIETQNVDVAGAFALEQLHLAPGRYVLLAVSDTGDGMDAVTQASIFEPFFTTKDAEKGTGLGLATVYGIVQQAGGAIYVYSEPGHGSIFKVYLPRVDAALPAPAAPAAATDAALGAPVAPGVDSGTVLLVEDDPSVRRFAALVLTEAGFRVIEAADAQAALGFAAGYPGQIDLLLSDVILPDTNGRALANRLQLTRPHIAILFTSGYTDDMVLRTGALAAGAGFVQKPFSPQTLVERVRSALQEARAAHPSH